jgi:hypothetical protein
MTFGRPPLANASVATGLRAADWLCLAATPVLTIMACLTGILGSGHSFTLCSDTWSPGGMIPMYLLMSAFHSAPWLRLVSNRRNGASHQPP